MRNLMMFAALCAVLGSSGGAMAAWEPEKPVEIFVTAPVGGRLDQMARLMQDIIVKHKLMKQDFVVVTKSGGGGLEGFLQIKNGRFEPFKTLPADDKVDPHRIMIVANNLFVLPLITGAPFHWTEVSPVAMLALEPSILWTHTENGYKSAMAYIDAAKAAGSGKMRMSGAGTRQEDRALTISIERATFAKFSYIPFYSSNGISAEPERFDSALYKPSDAATLWRDGVMVPQCVFNDTRLPYTSKATETHAWSDVPTCKEAGINVSYQSLRGIFMRAGATDEQVNYFIALFKRVAETPEWKAYMEKNAYSPTFMSGQEFKTWLTRMEETHKRVFKSTNCGFLPC